VAHGEEVARNGQVDQVVGGAVQCSQVRFDKCNGAVERHPMEEIFFWADCGLNLGLVFQGISKEKILLGVVILKGVLPCRVRQKMIRFDLRKV